MGGLIYLWYAELFHLPSCLMIDFGRPCFKAAVVALILKLWPENPFGSMSAAARASLKCVTKLLRVSSAPERNTNNGPSAFPLFTSQASIAVCKIYIIIVLRMVSEISITAHIVLCISLCLLCRS